MLKTIVLYYILTNPSCIPAQKLCPVAQPRYGHSSTTLSIAYLIANTPTPGVFSSDGDKYVKGHFRAALN